MVWEFFFATTKWFSDIAYKVNNNYFMYNERLKHYYVNTILISQI